MRGLWEKGADGPALHRWVEDNVGVRVPTQAVCVGHCAPFDYLRSAYLQEHRDLVVWAPRGGGKTFLGAVATLLDLLHKPGCGVRILGGSLEQSLRMWEHLDPLLQKLAEGQIEGKALARKIKLQSGSSAAVLTQSQRAVRGLRVQKLRCDEVEDFDPAIWEAAQLVTRSIKDKSDSTGEPILGAIEAISTLHRPFGLMQRIVDDAAERGRTILRWCLLEVLEKCPDERVCGSCVLHEDCGGAARKRCDGFMSIDDAIVFKHRVSKETWESEMMCRRPSLQRVVFGNFDEAVHVREELPEAAVRGADPAICLSIDFGYKNPFACLWIVRTGQGLVHVIDEYVQQGKIVAEHLKEIARRPWPKAAVVTCDPAGSARNEQTGESNVQLLAKAGYRVVKCSSHIADGVELVRSALAPAAGRPSLFVHPRCKRLIKALRAYHYGEGGGEVPEKDGEHDHLIDALRYHFVNVGKIAKSKGRPY